MLLDSNLSRRHFLGQVAFHLLPIGLQTLVVIDSESRLTSFPCFFTPPSEVSALFNSNLSRHPFLRQVVNLDLLLCRIRFGTCDFAPMSYFYSETNDSSQDWAKRWALLWSATTSRWFHRNFHFTLKKKWVVAARYLQSIKTFLAVELSQYRKSGSTFSSSEPAATAADSETPCVCARPSNPPKLCWSAAPRAWLLI